MALVFSSRSWESSCLGLLLLDLSICGPPNCFPQSFKLTTVTFIKMTMLMISDMMIVIYQLSRASLLTLWTTKLWRSIVDNDNYQSDDDVLRWLFLAAKTSGFWHICDERWQRRSSRVTKCIRLLLLEFWTTKLWRSEVDDDDYHFRVMLMLVMSTKCLRLLLLLLVVHHSSSGFDLILV